MNEPRLVFAQPASPARAVEIVGVACGQGAQDQHCSNGPDALRAGGLVRGLQARGLSAAWNETLRPSVEHRADPMQAVRDVCESLSRRVQAIVGQGKLPVVVGGDHSCALGTWKGVASAVRARGPLGLIWIDAHMDAHTPQTTPTGALHGMPLACLLGYGDERLTGLADSARLSPQHVCLIGVRSFETGEAALLERLGVRVFFMDEVARRGLGAVVREALAIATAGTAGFGVTLDLDALDPQEAPGVGSPASGGLHAPELAAALAVLNGHPALAGVEIAEYNPLRDRGGATARVAIEMLQALLVAQPTDARVGDDDRPPLTLVQGKGRAGRPRRRAELAQAA